MRLLKSLFFLFLLADSLFAFCPGDRFYAGPEVYYLRRWREGGTHQGGTISGVRVGYDYISCHDLYVGGDLLYADGTLHGKSSARRNLKSQLTDFTIEGRVGFTLQHCLDGPFFIPFVGYGYFQEENSFHYPSPIQFTFTDTFRYVTTGFFSGTYLNPCISMGINFKLRFMMNGESEVSDDPIYDNIELQMSDEMHVRVEAPIIIRRPAPKEHVEIAIIPFYEFRHFGGRVGYPFDFIDTKFSLAGATVALGYRF